MSGGSRVAAAAAVGVVALACLAPWPFASVEPFWSALFCAAVLALSSAWFLTGSEGRPLGRDALLAALLPPAVALVSVVPLPAGLVAALSPGVPRAFARAGAEAWGGWRTLSLFAPAGLDALVLLAACAATAWLTARAATLPRRRRVLAHVFVAGGVAVALFGLAQRLIDPDPQRMFWSVEIYEAGTPFGPYVNRNHFGGAMLLFTGVAAGRALGGGGAGRRERGVMAACAAVTTLALLGTASRGAILGLAVLAVLLVAAARGRGRLRLGLALAALSVLLVAGLAVTGLFGELADRLFRVYGRWENRFLVQADALRVAGEFPVFGTGAGTFPWVYHAFQRVDDVRHFDDAHSDWVQILMDSGLLGVLAAAAVLRALLASARRALRVESSERWHALGALAGCAGTAVHGLFETNLHIPANALLASVAAGLAYGAAVRAGPLQAQGGDA